MRIAGSNALLIQLLASLLCLRIFFIYSIGVEHFYTAKSGHIIQQVTQSPVIVPVRMCTVTDSTTRVNPVDVPAPEGILSFADIELFPTDFKANAKDRDAILAIWTEKTTK